MTTPSIADPQAIETLRDVLDRAPFIGEAIREALGRTADVARHRPSPTSSRSGTT